MAGGENALSESPETIAIKARDRRRKNGGAEQGVIPLRAGFHRRKQWSWRLQEILGLPKQAARILDISALECRQFVSLTYEGHEAKTVILQEAGGGLLRIRLSGSIELTAAFRNHRRYR